MEVHTTVETEDTSSHISNEEIDEYEASQAKFRALWEKKREKVWNNLPEIFFGRVKVL